MRLYWNMLMKIQLIFTILFFPFSLMAEKIIIPDYTLANKNISRYDQVPENEIIMAKHQALEPAAFFQGPMRGHGYDEPNININIMSLRNAGFKVYVDYFTHAKIQFYHLAPKYTICVSNLRSRQILKQLVEESKLTNKKKGEKKILYSYARTLRSPYGTIAVLKTNMHKFTKHLYPGTNIYNFKAILDDPDLYTVQVKDAHSGLLNYIYADKNKSNIKLEYKKKVYEFVASNSVQLILMLKGRRMHWADNTVIGDFYIHQLKLTNLIETIPYSHVHPDQLTIDDTQVLYTRCSGPNLSKLEKVIKIINENAKKSRLNEEFFTSVNKQYAKDFNLPYIGPKEFYHTKESFRYKEELEKGVFDFN